MLSSQWQLKRKVSFLFLFVCRRAFGFSEFVLYKNTFKAMKDSTGMLDEDKSLGGKQGKEKLAVEHSEIRLKTSSADNESEPEQLFVLAQVSLKLAHLPLTEVAQCAPSNASAYNTVKFCLLPCSALLSIIGGKSEFFCWEHLSSIISCWRGEGEQLNEGVFSLEPLSWGCTSLHQEVVIRAPPLSRTDN